MRQKLLISPSGSKLKFYQWLLVPIATIMRVTVTFLLFEVYQFLWIALNNEIKNSINICHYAYMYWLLQGIHVFFCTHENAIFFRKHEAFNEFTVYICDLYTLIFN
jgi:hypothetical protein